MIPYRDLLKGIGQRARELRIIRNLQQKEVATRAGLTRSTIVRFESTGRVSLENVSRIAMVLGAEEGLTALFQAPKYRNLDEALARPAPVTRQRVRKHQSRRR
jgi:transcriptional regulator with XRE-family HTH domain